LSIWTEQGKRERGRGRERRERRGKEGKEGKEGLKTR
jgi:hypothetical protein